MGRAFSPADADMLLSEARALGVNTVRLAHYPQNEYIVRKAEQMGIMLWEEIPVWQSIDFTNKETMAKARVMFNEMLQRDKNRCAITVWGVANPFPSHQPGRMESQGTCFRSGNAQESLVYHAGLLSQQGRKIEYKLYVGIV